MFFKRKKQQEKNPKHYVLNVIRYDKEGGCSSHWYGWSSNKWLFTYEEALNTKKKIQHLYDEIEIIEHV